MNASVMAASFYFMKPLYGITSEKYLVTWHVEASLKKFQLISH